MKTAKDPLKNKKRIQAGEKDSAGRKGGQFAPDTSGKKAPAKKPRAAKAKASSVHVENTATLVDEDIAKKYQAYQQRKVPTVDQNEVAEELLQTMREEDLAGLPLEGHHIVGDQHILEFYEGDLTVVIDSDGEMTLQTEDGYPNYANPGDHSVQLCDPTDDPQEIANAMWEYIHRN